VWERVCIDSFLRGGPLFSSMIREPGGTGIHMGGLTVQDEEGYKRIHLPSSKSMQ